MQLAQAEQKSKIPNDRERFRLGIFCAHGEFFNEAKNRSIISENFCKAEILEVKLCGSIFDTNFKRSIFLQLFLQTLPAKAQSSAPYCKESLLRESSFLFQFRICRLDANLWRPPVFLARYAFLSAVLLWLARLPSSFPSQKE